MVIYEVNLKVESGIWAEYSAWLKKHQKKMLKNDGFRGVKNYWVQASANSNEAEICVHYELESIEKLERYFRDHAEEMRSEALTLFGNKFSASRRVLLSKKDV